MICAIDNKIDRHSIFDCDQAKRTTAVIIDSKVFKVAAESMNRLITGATMNSIERTAGRLFAGNFSDEEEKFPSCTIFPIDALAVL